MSSALAIFLIVLVTCLGSAYWLTVAYFAWSQLADRETSSTAMSLEKSGTENKVNAPQMESGSPARVLAACAETHQIFYRKPKEALDEGQCMRFGAALDIFIQLYSDEFVRHYKHYYEKPDITLTPSTILENCLIEKASPSGFLDLHASNIFISDAQEPDPTHVFEPAIKQVIDLLLIKRASSSGVFREKRQRYFAANALNSYQGIDAEYRESVKLPQNARGATDLPGAQQATGVEKPREKRR